MDKNFMTAIHRSEQTVFTLRDLSVILGEKNYDNLKRAVNYYIKKGVLHNPRRGFYAKDDFDPFELAVKIYPPAYIGFETVLFREGVVFQYNPTIAVASYLSREIEVGTYLFKYTRLKGTVLSSPEGLVFKDSYVLADKERAFLDILYLNKDFYVDHAARLNKKRLFEIVKIYDNHSLEKKVKELFHA